ncbi:hypothetical protein H0H93_008216, partial [Arthromyces matolae]
AQVLEELRIDRDNVDLEQRELVLYSDFLRQWFLHRGYTLYSAWIRKGYDVVEGFEPQLPSESHESASVHLPHAFHGGDDSVNSSSVPELYATSIGRVLFAQDSQHHHVAIKIVKDGSDEHQVLRFLHEQGIPDTIEKFNHVIPVLDLLSFGEFWFAVMPSRWGVSPFRPHGPTIKQVLECIRDLLKDISRGNMLVNHFGRYRSDHLNPARRYMRQQNQLTYALFDFELSTKFPLSWSDEKCRLPYYRSFQGTPGCVPPDTFQGEFDFDPFARDVGSMGLVLAHEFEHLTIHAPLLAPFLDKMLTRDVPRRFTAQQSLDFLENVVYPGTSQEQLDLGVDARPSVRIDRWAGLDPDFLEKWAEYHEPPLPLTIRILRFICEYPWVNRTIAFLRKNMYRFRQALLKS